VRKKKKKKTNVSVMNSVLKKPKKTHILSVLQIEKELLSQLQYWRNCFTCACCCTGVLTFLSIIGIFIYFLFRYPLFFVSHIQISTLRERDKNTTISLRFIFQSENFNLIPISLEKLDGKLLVLDSKDPAVFYDLGIINNITRKEIASGSDEFHLKQYLDCGRNYLKVTSLLLNFQHEFDFAGQFEYRILLFNFKSKFHFKQECANGCKK
jgi:hypothetical protein